MWLSEPCVHLKDRDEQWWAAYNVLYNPGAEQASKQGRIDFNDMPDWDAIPLENIPVAYDLVVMAEKDARIAELEQNLKTTTENIQRAQQDLDAATQSLQDMTTKSQSQQDLLYTLWQRICASGCTDTYLRGMVQRTAPELLDLNEQDNCKTTRWKGKQAAAIGPVIPNDEHTFVLDSTLSGVEESPGDSGIWPDL
ncbi:uncharacterized protein MYCFIDRAFT_81595 [Pseudocercospora fijiensis CIRAD86]|uniref:Uncharacterized protein n=1 Tax=Pseudocercospora fijiensis (strain CIRAD86) TaxID=383855 RepID=M3AG54_PSEFD|nr:uncharacterized protein MYCFIDRAFT_81595 [Pseudocercospora fijiensis CIRAD86]EME83571.1 hypothetical protein MYCFIDRAFT_81595 [Pseudocercospora fijiensis CIRAD86]